MGFTAKLVTETKIPLGGFEARIDNLQLERVLYELFLGDSCVPAVTAAVITSVIVHNFLGPELNLHENCQRVHNVGQ